MVLTNYWWLLIWIFAVGGTMAISMPKQKEMIYGKQEYRWSWPAVIIVALPYVIWAATRTDFGDSIAYAKIFKEVPSVISDIPMYLSEHTKDKGFSVLMIVFKSIFGDSRVRFFFAIAAFQMFCIVTVFRKYSTNFWISMFIFIASTDYLSWMQNGMRQFIAVTIIFAGFSLLLEKKYIALVFLILLASTIHGSALIMLPVVFIIRGKAFNKKTMMFIVVIVTALFLLDRLTPIMNNLLADTQYSDLMTNEIWLNDDGTNIMRVLVYSVPAIMAVIGREYVKSADNPVINLCVNASVLTAFWYLAAAFSSGIYVGRLPIFISLYGNLCMPWLIDNIFTKESARLVKIAMVIGYLAFFYYQMHITWAIV
ncbi:MAG: EpsG family protein [Lachnospiraceae bacterium]|nr:EpsG family protein [Lachnospiraceae bacterium]